MHGSGLPTVVLVGAIGLVVAVRPDRTSPVRTEPDISTSSPTEDVPRALDTLVVGDLLAASIVVVGALALLRAFVAPVVLIVSSGLDWSWFVQLSLAAAGVIVIHAWPEASEALLGRVWLKSKLPNPPIGSRVE